MSKIINERYRLEDDIPPGKICENLYAIDTRSSQDVCINLVRTPKASDLIHNIVQARAIELSHLNHKHNLSLSDFGFDTANNLYYFVYLQPGNPGIPSGIMLKTYITKSELHISTICDFLLGLAGFLLDLHSKDIAHGGLNSQCILITDILHRDFLVLRTGLFHLFNLLEGDIGNSEEIDLESAKAMDLECLGKITSELLCQRLNPQPGDVQDSIQAQLPSIQPELEQIVGLETSTLIDNISDVKRLLTNVLRKLEGEKIYYLSLTKTVINQLHEFGFTPIDRSSNAIDFLNKELERRVYGKLTKKTEEGDDLTYQLTTSQLRLYCVHDNRPNFRYRNLVIRGISLRDPADLVLDWEYGLKILAHLRVEDAYLVPSEANVIPLTKAIEDHTENFQKRTEEDLEDKNKFKLWEDLLAEQHRLLGEFKLAYSAWEEVDNGASVEISLIDIPKDNSVELSEDDLICMTDENARPRAVGYFEDLTGNKLKLGLARNVDLSMIASSGILTLDNRQVEAVIFRQKQAIKRLRFRETLNPRLLDFLTDPSKLSIYDPLDVKFWFQDILDKSQKLAVRKALANQDIFLIHGPPGTGKTSVIAELVLQIIQSQEQVRILVSSQSNVAVNNALDKIVNLNPGLSSQVVRIGREEKAGSTEGLLLDRQLQNWRTQVLHRSEQHLADWENKASDDRNLSGVFGTLDECQEMERKLNQKLQEFQESEVKLAELEKKYDLLDQSLIKAGKLKEKAESLLSTVLEDDERLRKTLHSFHHDYLEWASAFLEKADQVSGVSFMRIETAEIIRQLGLELDHLKNEIDAGKILINEFMQKEFNKSFTSLNDMRKFIDDQFEHQREEMIKLGRVRRIVDEWKKRVGKDYQEFSLAYLSCCKVVGATCLGVAAKGDISELEFDWVIVDEAGKATHPELLVPIVRGRKIVLVGDHRQLPPTIGQDLDDAIESKGLQKEELRTSLFQELMLNANNDVKLSLTVQYRMHPDIGKLIGECFYSDVGLENGVDAIDRQHGLDWCPKAVIWYSTSQLKQHAETRSGYSKLNQAEAAVVIDLLEKMEATYAKSNNGKKSIGVITGYLAQKELIRHMISSRKQSFLHLLDIEINTVDAYQGRERDIIIYSVVRSNPDGQIGFLADQRRLNVALSRPRELLIIIGDDQIETADVRGKNPFYDVIKHIRNNSEGCTMEVLQYGYK